MRKRLIILVVISILSVYCVTAQSPQTDAAQKIELTGSGPKNFYRIDEGVYRSEQPSVKDFKALKKYGIGSVLSLRNWNNDENEAEGLGLNLYRLKTRASKLTENDIIDALKIIVNRSSDIVIHCWHGSDRTGAVCAMYRVVVQGWSKEDAIDEMLNGDFGFHKQFKDHIVNLIETADVDKIKKAIEN